MTWDKSHRRKEDPRFCLDVVCCEDEERRRSSKIKEREREIMKLKIIWFQGERRRRRRRWTQMFRHSSHAVLDKRALAPLLSPLLVYNRFSLLTCHGSQISVSLLFSVECQVTFEKISLLLCLKSKFLLPPTFSRGRFPVIVCLCRVSFGIRTTNIRNFFLRLLNVNVSRRWKI